MAVPKPSLLVVEDSPTITAMYRAFLDGQPYDVRYVTAASEALEQVDAAPPTLVLLDLNLPDQSGLNVLQHIHQQQIPSAVIVITGHGSVEAAVDAMQMGAIDFIEKPIELERFLVTIRNAIKLQELTQAVDRFRETYERQRFHGFYGQSQAMQSVYQIIENASNSKATLFITGESGTGKEVCAEAIHQQSQRRNKPFIPLNCGAIPKDLMESEIFGHIKGAFTGASAARAGAAEAAHGGTLFLDEICEMSMDLQVKLLRFIQTGTVQRVGSSEVIKVDVRFVCATNRDPWQEVQEGRFREDLYYRLHVIPIELPPLRQREGDVALLAHHFLQLYSKEEGKLFEAFEPAALQAMIRYSWPGNIRELQNVVRQLVVLQSGPILQLDMLPARLRQQAERATTTFPAAPSLEPTVNAHPDGTIRPLWLEEKTIIERAIQLCDGNIPRAASLLEVSASTLYRKKQQWDEQAG